jgi:hypothetical protein
LGAVVVIQIEAAIAAVVTRGIWSYGAISSWSFFSATKFWKLKLATKSHIKPDMISGEISTSNGRPFWSSGAEGLVRLETSGFVLVSSHGCSELSS